MQQLRCTSVTAVQHVLSAPSSVPKAEPAAKSKRGGKKGIKIVIGTVAAAAVAVGAGAGFFSLSQSAIIYRAEAAVSDGDYELALTLYEKVSRLSTDKSKAEAMISKLNGAKAAARDAGKALENDDEGEMKKYISKAYSLIPDYKPAAEIEDIIVLKDKTNEAENYVNSGEYAQVLALAKDIESDAPDSEYAAKYIEQIENSVKIVEDFEAASIKNAKEAIKNGNTAEAENITSELLRRLPDSEQGKTLKSNLDNVKSATVLIQSAQAKKNSGDYSGAITDMDNAFAKYPAYKVAYSQLYNDTQNQLNTQIQQIKINAEMARKAAEAANQYIIPDSNSRYLTRNELLAMSSKDLRYARNEIYARHGRRFKDAELQAYFDSCSWYNGTIAPDSFDSSVLNTYENANKDLILKVEKERG